MFAKIAPYLNDVLATDVGVTIVREGKYALYIPAADLDLKTKVGEPVLAGATKQALETGKQVVKLITKEKSSNGVAYVANAMPFKDGNRVAGCVTTTQSVSSLDKVTSISGELAASSEELTAGMEEVSGRAVEVPHAFAEQYPGSHPNFVIGDRRYRTKCRRPDVGCRRDGQGQPIAGDDGH